MHHPAFSPIIPIYTQTSHQHQNPSQNQPRLPSLYKIARILGGLATPPGTLHGSLVTKKLHRPSRAHASARSSSQNSSPMGVP